MMRRATELDLSCLHRLEQPNVPEAYPCERLDLGLQLYIDGETRIEQTKVDVRAMQHEPEPAIAMATKAKQDDNALVRERIDADHPPEGPHQEIRIEMLIGEIPACSPTCRAHRSLRQAPARPPSTGTHALGRSRLCNDR
jgi:hypothetical protein